MNQDDSETYVLNTRFFFFVIIITDHQDHRREEQQKVLSIITIAIEQEKISLREVRVSILTRACVDIAMYQRTFALLASRS